MGPPSGAGEPFPEQPPSWGPPAPPAPGMQPVTGAPGEDLEASTGSAPDIPMVPPFPMGPGAPELAPYPDFSMPTPEAEGEEEIEIEVPEYETAEEADCSPRIWYQPWTWASSCTEGPLSIMDIE